MKLQSEFLNTEKGESVCALCLENGIPLTDEHIFPRCFGGKIMCQFLCESCNRRMGKIEKDFGRGMIPRLYAIISKTKRRISPQEFIGNFSSKVFDVKRNIIPSLEVCKIAYELACIRFGLKYAKESYEAMQLRMSLLSGGEQDSDGLVLPLIDSELPQLVGSIPDNTMWATEFHGLTIVSLMGATQGIITEKSDERFRTGINDAKLFLSPRQKGGNAMIVSLGEWYKTHHIDNSEVDALIENFAVNNVVSDELMLLTGNANLR